MASKSASLVHEGVGVERGKPLQQLPGRLHLNSARSQSSISHCASWLASVIAISHFSVGPTTARITSAASAAIYLAVYVTELWLRLNHWLQYR